MIKRTLAMVVSIVLILTSLCGCTGQSNNEKKYIGIVSAIDSEIDVLLDKAKISRKDTIGNVEYNVGTLFDQPVIICKAGIGKVRASSGVTAMFDKYPISKVIFTGIAGGVADDTKVLDEVIATRLVEHDYGIITNEGFEWRSGDPGIGNEPGEYYPCDKELVDLAYNASVEVVGDEHTFKGTVATGDQFVASKEYVEKLKKEYDAYACEMEGASVAVICIKYNKPFVVIRALSDKADGEAHENYENFADVAGANSSRIVLKMLEAMGK